MENTGKFEKYLLEEKGFDKEKFIKKVIDILDKPLKEMNKIIIFKEIQDKLDYNELTVLALKGCEAFVQERERFKELSGMKEDDLLKVIKGVQDHLKKSKNSDNLDT